MGKVETEGGRPEREARVQYKETKDSSAVRQSPCDPAIPLLRVPREPKPHVHTRPCTRVLMTAKKVCHPHVHRPVNAGIPWGTPAYRDAVRP